MITVEESKDIIKLIYNDEKPKRGIFFNYGQILYYLRCPKNSCNSKEFEASEIKREYIIIRETTVIVNREKSSNIMLNYGRELKDIKCNICNSIADYMIFSI